MIKVNKDSQWKPLAIESNEGFNCEELNGLVGIEELDEYCLQNNKNIDSNDKKRKKTSKKKNKKLKTKPNQQKTDKTIDGLESGSEEEEDTEVVHKKLRKSMHLWESLNIEEPILKALEEMSFTTPTPIQEKAIKVAVEDKFDILGAAETGSGKTLAFGIPLLTHIMKDKSTDDSPKLRALVVAPTRELAIQVKKHLESVGKYCGVSIGVIVGGMAVQKQERILNKVRPDIIVATPGRLWELIEDQSSQHLSVDSVMDLKYLVIDEADRMAEKGHFKDLIRLLDIIKQKTIDRQIMVFSATLTLTYSLPKRMIGLKSNKTKGNKTNEKQKLNQFMHLFGMRADSTQVIDLTRKGVGTPGAQQLTECKINCLAQQKDLYLYYFLNIFKGRTLVFCNSKDCLRRLVNVLKLLEVSPLPLHASMPQKRRLANLEKFESSPHSVLIASDVAARGLDIANIDHVVHYQIPRTAEIYVHRSGRTARAFNRGLSLMLCEPKEEANFYKQLCNTLNSGLDLQEFPIEQSVLKTLKQRIDLAQKCDQLDHKVRKERSRRDWFRTNAKKCEILTDDDDNDSEEETDETSLEIRRLKAMKKQLNSLLKKPISRTKSFYAHLLRNETTNWTQIKGIPVCFDSIELITKLFDCRQEKCHRFGRRDQNKENEE